ncbi:MAG TPA: tetratricopeptide repeat protein [Pedobacter sp.]|uniref:tetratricopeptide repeat protein n=1 Tax=Pedobacter sp. TaxID=1411316 RepID=UPI002C2893C2|nr:tetratricopeptide repeat protein [Pedobacter sp.]HMI01249.1 tetratricopeptide repeat protein [Pedobacter sp.]
MGRNRYVLLLLLIFPLFSQGSEKAENLFVKGNDLYAKGKYKEAAASYEQVLSAGYFSAEVYFNLGNAYYKQEEIPLAILNYEKAGKLSPGDDDIKVNIQLANLKIADKIDAVPEFFLTKWWRSFLLFCPAEVLSVLSAAGFLLGFALLVVYLFAVSITIKRPAFYSGIVLLVLALLITCMASLQTSYLKRSNGAIVFAGTVNVKSGPKDSFKTLFVIHEGLKVSVTAQNEGWIRIGLPNGNVGWITAASVKKI